MRLISRQANLPVQVTANVTTAQVFPDLITTTNACVLPVPGGSRFEQKRWIVRASGYIVTAVTTNVTLTLYSGTSKTVSSDTVIKASTATAQNSATAPWWMEAYLVCESVGGAGHGTAKFLINNTLVAEAAITALASLNMATEPAINLCLGVTFSAADAGNKAVLTEFAVGF